MKYNYILTARGNYFKFIITSVDLKTYVETYVGMYDLPIKQCVARGIYSLENGDVLQRGLVLVCGFPYKSFSMLEMAITEDSSDRTQTPNTFVLNGEEISMYGFFENLLTITG